VHPYNGPNGIEPAYSAWEDDSTRLQLFIAVHSRLRVSAGKLR
jgi:hypothetical protein